MIFILKLTLNMELIDTPNPNAKKIVADEKLLIQLRSDESKILISKKLNGVTGVSTVFFGPDFLTISKDEDIEWDSITQNIVDIFDKL